MTASHIRGEASIPPTVPQILVTAQSPQSKRVSMIYLRTQMARALPSHGLPPAQGPAWATQARSEPFAMHARMNENEMNAPVSIASCHCSLSGELCEEPQDSPTTGLRLPPCAPTYGHLPPMRPCTQQPGAPLAQHRSRMAPARRDKASVARGSRGSRSASRGEAWGDLTHCQRLGSVSRFRSMARCCSGSDVGSGPHLTRRTRCSGGPASSSLSWHRSPRPS